MQTTAVHADFIRRAAEAIYRDQASEAPFEPAVWDDLSAKLRAEWVGRAFNTPYVTTMSKDGVSFHVVARLCEAYYIQYWDSRAGQWWGAMTRDRLSLTDAVALRRKLWESEG